MTKFSKIVLPIMMLMILASPVLSFANNHTINSPTPNVRDATNGLVPCGNLGQKDCNFEGVMKLINNIIGFALFYLALPIAALMFVYAGVLLITSGGAEGKSKAKGIFMNAVIGLLCAAGAYLVVKLILNVLGFDGGWIGF